LYKCIYGNMLPAMLADVKCWDLLFLVIIGICWYGKRGGHNLFGVASCGLSLVIGRVVLSHYVHKALLCLINAFNYGDISG
jgi:hypothetical protein